MADEQLFEDLPEQERPRAEGRGALRLRVPERSQIGMQMAALDDLIADDHPVRSIWAFVEGLDLSALHDVIKAREGQPGHPPAAPELMLALWLWATVDGVGSARQLDRLCRDHLAYRWLCGGVSMNYHSLSTFRIAHMAVLERLLAQGVASMVDAGLVSLDTLAQDGLRVRASAGASSFRRRARLDDLLTAAQTRVARLRAEVETDPAAGDRRQRAAKERGARERETRIVAAQERMKELAAERERREKTNKKQVAKQKEPRASTTDAEARVMKMADGGWRPAYNMQIMSAPAYQVVVAVDSDTSGSDRGLARLGIETVHAEGYDPSNYLVDGGFTKSDDIEWAHAKDIKLWCPAGQTKHGTDPYAPKKDDGVGVADWRARMQSEDGKAFYRLRAEHECVNAHARRMGLRQLSLRGKIKARIHLLWFAVAHNMMRLFALGDRANSSIAGSSY
ncbi:IS5/IS1182 family transposase [Bradyrhizobium genosp. SA-3]|uniref:IS1182 family transposase n=1 Tax=Bradyrhizobium genosp. SA-3 TaxID=508868 RepID=UPI00102A05D2|nr:IS1182 family transposase [Bradyrhizobium genosp. SA-3]RZM88538.1 IS5/IS1182 family transposase [Bradyrhizobium genosp. SA-3]